MIRLDRSREGMLAEIGVSEAAFANRVDDPSDPAFLEREQTSVVVRDTWAQMLPRIRPPLARRFSSVPPEQFIRDIGRPLKMGLGNADKRGHRGDPQKRITVEVVVTKMGAVISVSDEGLGFDVAETLRRFRSQESYYQHKGGGFKAFERAGSLITFADGGRTLLIRFLRVSEQTTPGLAVADDFMMHVLSKLPMIAKRGKTLESCQIRRLERSRPNQPEMKYVLSIRDGTGERETAVLTGRLVPESAARREYSVAKQLYKGSFKVGGLRVPKPMAVFKLHPRLVLYRFDPAMDLREYLDNVSGRERARAVQAVAVGLRTLHGSEISVDVDERPRPREQRRRVEERITRTLAEVLPDRVSRARRFFGELERLATGEDRFPERAPIHGSFGWDCVRLASDPSGADQLHLYRFHACRLDHPGVDVGCFLADLPGSSGEAEATGEVRRAHRDDFLGSYLAGDSPSWLHRLPFFTVCAHLARLEHAVHGARRASPEAIDALLDRCEESLGPAPSP